MVMNLNRSGSSLLVWPFLYLSRSSYLSISLPRRSSSSSGLGKRGEIFPLGYRLCMYISVALLYGKRAWDLLVHLSVPAWDPVCSFSQATAASSCFRRQTGYSTCVQHVTHFGCLCLMKPIIHFVCPLFVLFTGAVLLLGKYYPSFCSTRFITSAPIGAWKSSLPPFQEIMTDRQNSQQTDMRVQQSHHINICMILLGTFHKNTIIKMPRQQLALERLHRS